MRLMIDSFWRALAYCLHPRVIALSILPLVLMVAVAFALAYFFWDAAVAAVLYWLETWALVTFAMGWLESLGVGNLGAVFAPLVVLMLATPLIVLVSLVLVAWLMTPALVDLVARRRFPALERRQGAGWWGSVWWSLGSTVLALLALIASIPFWLIPPLVLVLPPLIWGWLSYRVFAFDALADHASRDERLALMAQHRTHLLVMGLACGMLGAAPSLLWASGAMFIALAPLLVPLAMWIYALVFALASLWYTHYLLAALERARGREIDTNTVLPSASAPIVPSTIDVQARELP